ncbi:MULTISPECIES: helix-turn-helix transcriptional regulator [unclassified Lactobacillus]|uniref:helix-turn-helix transcriptional regulator n=1 Tax=unclassified Lactobacillus TaxID=2620435 RepID=UPI000EFD472C|nr:MULTISPECIES: AraC family transcriptional regulator [unclassified Lactobacillus]RMC26018.1 AraC family transcriptional regulator [Lactobacillus sp. ESL0247]RMC29711.1 AraC family transcriptional regulator [Lactobacillus sp. ESL0246]RMC34116.1 AraC family transcriptional regulator [Lactobacillus sp. ESL0245]
MVAFKLEQYLASILDAVDVDSNEVQLKVGNSSFDIFTAYLENRNAGIHRYQTTNTTILYEITGKTKIRNNGRELKLGPGNIMILRRKCEYDVQTQLKGNVLLKLEFNSNLNFKTFLINAGVLDPSERNVINNVHDTLKTRQLLYIKSSPISKPAQLLKEIIDEYLNQNMFTQSMIIAQLSILFITTIRNRDLIVIPDTIQEFEPTTLEQYIDDNYAKVTLAQAAQYFGFNTNYFSSLVKQKTGKSFVEHVDERRMQEARNLLARPDISIKEIIAHVGYSGKSFFYKKFNEYYHETPVQMRTELFRQANINLK